MSRNPIVFTKQILDAFLRYQGAAFPFSDPRLAAQAEVVLGARLTCHLDINLYRDPTDPQQCALFQAKKFRRDGQWRLL